MEIYTLLLLIGAIGFAAMVALGFIHTGGHHDAGGHHAMHGHHHGGVDAIGQHHAPIGSHVRILQGSAKGAHQGHHGVGRVAKFGKFKSVLMISPVDIFSLCLGAGATGLLARGLASPAILPFLAAAGALLFNYGLVRPLFGIAYKFASKESEGLEGMIAHTGEAVTRFDAQGRGLVQLILDGEAKQLLAKLDQEELESGIQIARGDQVLVLDVDPVKNSCRVTRI